MTKKRGLSGNKGLNALLANIKVGRQVEQTLQTAEQHFTPDSVVAENIPQNTTNTMASTELELSKPSQVPSLDGVYIDERALKSSSSMADGTVDTVPHDIADTQMAVIDVQAGLSDEQWQAVLRFWQVGLLP